jgi:hypothetical protein
MSWQTFVKNAALGVLAMAAVEVLDEGLRRLNGHQPRIQPRRSATEQGLRLALGGALAAGYSRFVPAETWSRESGMAFAQLPVVLSLVNVLPRPNADHDGGTNPTLEAVELSLWGAVLGQMMSWWGEDPRREERRTFDIVKKARSLQPTS